MKWLRKNPRIMIPIVISLTILAGVVVYILLREDIHPLFKYGFVTAAITVGSFTFALAMFVIAVLNQFRIR